MDGGIAVEGPDLSRQSRTGTGTGPDPRPAFTSAAADLPGARPRKSC